MQSSNTKYFLIQFTKYWSFRLKYEYISSVVFSYTYYFNISSVVCVQLHVMTRRRGAQQVGDVQLFEFLILFKYVDPSS